PHSYTRGVSGREERRNGTNEAFRPRRGPPRRAPRLLEQVVVGRVGVGRRRGAAPTLPPLLWRRPGGVPRVAAVAVVFSPDALGDVYVVVARVFRVFGVVLVLGLVGLVRVVVAALLSRLVLVAVSVGLVRTISVVVVAAELVPLFLAVVPVLVVYAAGPLPVVVLTGEDMVTPGGRVGAAGSRGRRDGTSADRQHRSYNDGHALPAPASELPPQPAPEIAGAFHPPHHLEVTPCPCHVPVFRALRFGVSYRRPAPRPATPAPSTAPPGRTAGARLSRRPPHWPPPPPPGSALPPPRPWPRTVPPGRPSPPERREWAAPPARSACRTRGARPARCARPPAPP